MATATLPQSSRPCKTCGVHFAPPREGQAYCQRACYLARAPMIERTCPGCGVKWNAPKSNPSHYCSKPCLESHQGWKQPRDASCLHCGTRFNARYRHARDAWEEFCSPACGNSHRRKMEERTCVSCGVGFLALPDQANRTCSWSCRNNFYRLERAASWNGGVYFTDEVKRVKVDREGYAAKYEAEYRLIAGRAIGRPLVRGEVVIHIDRDRTNNQEDNLFLCGSQSEHQRRRAGKSLPWPTASNLSEYNRPGYRVEPRTKRASRRRLITPTPERPDNGV